MNEATVGKPGHDPMLRLESVSKPGPRVVPTRNRWRSLKVGNYIFAILGLVLILGTVQVSQAMGYWTTSGKVTAEGTKIQATGANPDELKGWMKIEEVLVAYGLSQKELYERFNIPATLPPSAQLKDIEKEAPGFSMENLRAWLKERVAQPPAGK